MYAWLFFTPIIRDTEFVILSASEESYTRDLNAGRV